MGVTVPVDERAVTAIGTHGAQQKVSELTGLLDFLADRELASVLEIGSWTGGTLWLWSQLADRVVSIDVNEVPIDHIASGQITLVQGDSHLESTKDRLPLFSYDLVHIDGDHTELGARRDFEMYAPLLAPGGLIVIHDIVPHLAISGIHVEPFWAELRASRETVEFVDPLPCALGGQGSYDAGIGVVL